MTVSGAVNWEPAANVYIGTGGGCARLSFGAAGGLK
jgi:hypothetical protein